MLVGLFRTNTVRIEKKTLPDVEIEGNSKRRNMMQTNTVK